MEFYGSLMDIFDYPKREAQIKTFLYIQKVKNK